MAVNLGRKVGEKKEREWGGEQERSWFKESGVWLYNGPKKAYE